LRFLIRLLTTQYIEYLKLNTTNGHLHSADFGFRRAPEQISLCLAGHVIALKTHAARDAPTVRYFWQANLFESAAGFNNM